MPTDVGGSECSHLELAMDHLERETEALERLLLTSEPQTIREVLIVTALAGYLPNALTLQAEDAASITNCAVLEHMFSHVVPALERLAGVTVAELGLESYFRHPESVSDLLAAAVKVEAEHKVAEAA